METQLAFRAYSKQLFVCAKSSLPFISHLHSHHIHIN